MQYRKDKYGNEISLLGYGCMRFSRSGGRIDLKKAERELLAAIDAGVNYFDTAYIYPGSEAALGEIVAKNNLRDKIYIATKLPHYMIRSREGLDKCFSEQLNRLQTDHIDYYLMHMLTDPITWEKLTELGVVEWLKEKQKTGAIRQVGFSFHGNTDTFCRLVDAYDWDFCQIQYNYMDEHSQAGRRGLQYAAQKGLPVVIMEPLRGGRLARLPESAQKIMEKHPAKGSPAQWALRWLWGQPEVTCVLSGMNSLEMIRENAETADKAAPLTKEDQEMLSRVVAAINAKTKVGCTGCGYCSPCPKGVDIPGAFAAYNRRYSEGWFVAMKEHFMCTALGKTSGAALNCVGCGKCEGHCPQSIPIRAELKNVRKKLEGPIYRIAAFFARKFRAR